ERNPPDEIIGHAEDECCSGPRTARDLNCQPRRTQQLTRQPYSSKKPTSLGNTRHFQVEDTVKTDDHPQAGEYLRMVDRRHACVPEEPLGIGGGIEAPGDVVETGDQKDGAVEFTTWDHGFARRAATARNLLAARARHRDRAVRTKTPPAPSQSRSSEGAHQARAG